MKLSGWRNVFLYGMTVITVSTVTAAGEPANKTNDVIIIDERAPAPKKAPDKTSPKVSEKPAPKKEEPKKEEPMGKIEGQEIKRGSGYLGLELVSGTFKLSFYDAKKKPVAADVARAALRWPVAYRELDERTILNRSADGKSLTSPKVVKPPHNFKLFITLIPGEGAEETGTETLVVDFRG